jgi:hypothetical protein
MAGQKCAGWATDLEGGAILRVGCLQHRVAEPRVEAIHPKREAFQTSPHSQ